MKKSLRTVSILLVFGIIFGGVLTSIGQQRPPMVGGYKKVAADAPEVAAAAAFAVGEQGRKQESTIKLISVERAERQVVAGSNFRMCMKVEIEDKERNVIIIQEVKAVVFRNLKNIQALRSWEEADCSEDD